MLGEALTAINAVSVANLPESAKRHSAEQRERLAIGVAQIESLKRHEAFIGGCGRIV